MNRGFHHRTHAPAKERLLSAAGNVTAVRLAVDPTRDLVRERRVFGKLLSKMQNSRFKLAAQAFVDRCVGLHNDGQLSAEDAARAKLFASEVYGRAVDEGVQLHSGAGFMDEDPICRMCQDERINCIFAGASEVMKEVIARSIID
jgi:acyl-CoA dehydrogenase